jgi:hypothetical protein
MAAVSRRSGMLSHTRWHIVACQGRCVLARCAKRCDIIIRQACLLRYDTTGPLARRRVDVRGSGLKMYCCPEHRSTACESVQSCNGVLVALAASCLQACCNASAFHNNHQGGPDLSCGVQTVKAYVLNVRPSHPSPTSHTTTTTDPPGGPDVALFMSTRQNSATPSHQQSLVPPATMPLANNNNNPYCQVCKVAIRLRRLAYSACNPLLIVATRGRSTLVTE